MVSKKENERIIVIDKAVWKKLWQLRVDLEARSLNEVIAWLLKRKEIEIVNPILLKRKK